MNFRFSPARIDSHPHRELTKNAIFLPILTTQGVSMKTQQPAAGLGIGIGFGMLDRFEPAGDRGVECPACSSTSSRVVRTNRRRSRISRERSCRACGSVFTTSETTLKTDLHI